jgi:hypothetical protein
MSKPKPISLDEAKSIEISYDDWTQINSRLNHPDTAQAALLELAKRDLPYTVRTQIAEAANTDEEVLEQLIKHPTQRWEWRAISTKYRELYASFIKNYEGNEPLCKDMVSGRFSSPALSAAYLMEAGGMLAEDLWHDLATRDIIELGYQVDTYDGDQFGPIYDSKLDLSGSAQYLLSPGYFCEWINKVPEADTDYVFETFMEDYVEDYLEEQLFHEEADVTESGYAVLVAAAYGFTNGHLIVADREAYNRVITEAVEEFDSEMVDQTVEIIAEPAIVGKRFKDLDEKERDFVIDNLLSAEKHFLTSGFDISSHLLALVLLHPNTSDEQKAKILGAINQSAISSTVRFLS